ncbi:MAG: ATP-binding protein, partial [Planctomycetota bacterium]
CKSVETKTKYTMDSEEPHTKGIFNVTTFPLFDKEGRFMGTIRLARDVTEHKKLWSHLIQSEKMSALGLLVAGIAHEINNPLSVVMGYTQSLLKKTPEINQFELAKIHKNAQRAVNIVKHLLSFTRCENIAEKHTDIHEVIEESFALFTQELKLRNIRLVKKYNRLPLVVNGEINQIQQVFVNIISNALDALMSQKNTERVLSIKTVKDGNLAKVILEDTGCGIPDREVKRIFDPFFTTKEVGKGTGLGLSICYKIIQNHGGDIHVTSQLGKGTAFTIELPLTSIKRLQNMGMHPSDTEKVDNAHPTVKTMGVRKKDRRVPRIHP